MYTVPRIIKVILIRNSTDEIMAADEETSDDTTTVNSNVVGVVDITGDDGDGKDELKMIFDDDHINKYNDSKGKPRWKCKWCSCSFAGWNATKALAHVVKGSKADIKFCTGKISSSSRALYIRLYERCQRRRSASRDRIIALTDSIKTNNNRAAHSYSEEKERSSKRQRIPASNELSQETPSGLTTHGTLSTTTTMNHASFQKKVAPSFTQTLLHDGPNPNAESKLTMAIADMIHSCGLSFSLGSEPKFRLVLQIAKAVGSGYLPPLRKDIGGKLLELNYKNYMKNNMEKLKQEASTYGITFYGDGATIKKMPLINVLASGAHLPVFVLEIADCSKHLALGGKKDARYIASLFRPHIDSIEASIPGCTDVVYFDGASNVQKGGRILEAKNPRIAVFHGAEHVVSLFYKDLFDIPEIKYLSEICKRTYRVFGNGAHHAAYAIFQKYSKRHNEGKNIGLIRAADTRMGGQAIVMQRFLRLRNALISTVTSHEFLAIKVYLYSFYYLFRNTHI
jgi:Protein of unknown function (DUF 659)